MAYHLTHTIEFNTPVTEQFRIELHRKDIAPDEVIPLVGIYAKKQVLNGSGKGADSLLSCQFDFGMWIREDSGVDFSDFIVSFHDEWKVIAYCDGQTEFVGFLTPNEGESSLIGLRKSVDLTATDNLGLIKKTPLLKYDGTEFRAVDRIIDYIAGAMAQTGLQLPIRLYSNIYEASMPDRSTNPQADTFNQAKVHYSTFLVDPVTFDNCYSCLEKIFDEGFSIEQWAGTWVIMRIGEMQDSPGPKVWYTDYDYTGAITDAQLVDHDPALIDKDQTLHPLDADLTIKSNYSVKRAKHTYNYVPWPEIPKNNTFERGTVFEEGPLIDTNDIDDDGNTSEIIGVYKKSTIDDWTFGRTLPGSPSTFPPWPPGVPAPPTEQAYRLSHYNEYGVEIARMVVLENGNSPGHTFLVATAFPIKGGDKFDINTDFRLDRSGSGTMDYMMVWLQPDSGGLPYRLDNNNPPDGGGPFFWDRTGALRFMSKFYQGENWVDWTSLQIVAPGAPESGMLYIAFMNYDSTNTKSYYRNFELIYHPYVAGGYIEAVGDYWLTQQNSNYLDEIDEEVFISDSEIKVLKGAIYRNNGIDLTERSWHRLGVNENRGYKELINMARYNQAYRRFWEVSGTIGGIAYYPASNQAIRYPLGFHKHFYFRSIPLLDDIPFQLVPPLTIDYSAGKTTANFRESFRPGANDGNQEGDLHEFKYKFK